MSYPTKNKPLLFTFDCSIETYKKGEYALAINHFIDSLSEEDEDRCVSLALESIHKAFELARIQTKGV